MLCKTWVWWVLCKAFVFKSPFSTEQSQHDEFSLTCFASKLEESVLRFLWLICANLFSYIHETFACFWDGGYTLVDGWHPSRLTTTHQNYELSSLVAKTQPTSRSCGSQLSLKLTWPYMALFCMVEYAMTPPHSKENARIAAHACSTKWCMECVLSTILCIHTHTHTYIYIYTVNIYIYMYIQYMYMKPPHVPMYPHFCGVNIINSEVKTCFHVSVSNVQGSTI